MDLQGLRIDRSAPRNSRFAPAVIGIAVVAVLAGAGVWLYPQLKGQFFKTEVAITEILSVSPAQAAIVLTSTGYVKPDELSQVGAPIQGRIAEVFVKEGDTVKQGDLLARMENAQQKSAMATARAEVASAKARAQNARASLHEIEQQLIRERTLAAKGAVAQARVDDMQARADTLKEAVAVAQSDAEAAQLRVQAHAVDLKYTEIRAPISGTIVNKPLQVGEIVGLSLERTGIVEIANLNSLYVETDVPEGKLDRVKIGGPCEIRLDAYAERRFRGEAFEIRPQVNRAKATVPVKVRFVDDTKGVLPDMAATVSFLTEALQEGSLDQRPKVVVPESAIVRKGNQRAVFVLTDDVVRYVPVELGERFANGYVLKRGPEVGTKIVDKPPKELKSGHKIKERES